MGAREGVSEQAWLAWRLVIWQFRPCYRVGNREKGKGHVSGLMGWSCGGEKRCGLEAGWHKPFHCLCRPTASPLAGSTPAGGTGGLLVSVRGLSSGVWKCPFHGGCGWVLN